MPKAASKAACTVAPKLNVPILGARALIPVNDELQRVMTINRRAEGADAARGLSGKGRFTVEDRFEEERAYVSEMMGSAMGGAEKPLMGHDARLPESVDTTAGFQLTLQILNAMFIAVSTMH